MYNEKKEDKLNDEVMPSTLAELTKEIHEQISKLQNTADIVHQKNILLSGEAIPETEPGKGNSRAGVLGGVQDALMRLRKVNTFLSYQVRELENKLG